MGKRCPRCTTENTDDAYWCVHCNLKLVDTMPSDTTNVPVKNNGLIRTETYQPYQQPHKTGLKLVVGICIISIVTICILGYLNWDAVSGFEDITTKFNEDFWFEENKLITSEGWTFTMTKVNEYTLDGIVLALKTYDKNDWPYKPYNIFSPLDLVIGIDDVKENTDTYEYTIRSFHDRTVSWVLHYESITDYNYFTSHTGNNHIIPHNEEVLHALSDVDVFDCVVLEGSLINLYGTNGAQEWYWNTDTNIGNYNCEIILVDAITIY